MENSGGLEDSPTSVMDGLLKGFPKSREEGVTNSSTFLSFPELVLIGLTSLEDPHINLLKEDD